MDIDKSVNLFDIKLIVLDVDGTMTDGGVYIDNNGIESKKFSIKDGAGILLAETMGIEFMILTGRESVCVSKRAQELRVKHVFQGISNKNMFLEKFIADHAMMKSQIAYIGDDLNDLAAMQCVGICACPSDAVNEIKDHCHILLKNKGGEGVVREFVEIVLKQKGQWQEAIEKLFG